MVPENWHICVNKGVICITFRWVSLNTGIGCGLPSLRLPPLTLSMKGWIKYGQRSSPSPRITSFWAEHSLPKLLLLPSASISLFAFYNFFPVSCMWFLQARCGLRFSIINDNQVQLGTTLQISHSDSSFRIAHAYKHHKGITKSADKVESNVASLWSNILHYARFTAHSPPRVWGRYIYFVRLTVFDKACVDSTQSEFCTK